MECDLKALLRPFLLSYYSDTSFLRRLYMMKFLPFLLSFSFSSFLFSFVLFFPRWNVGKMRKFLALLLVKFNLHRWDSYFFFSLSCTTFLTSYCETNTQNIQNIRKRNKIENEILFQFAFRISFSRHAKALTSAAEANKHQKLSPAWIFKLACATWCIAKDILRKKYYFTRITATEKHKIDFLVDGMKRKFSSYF